MSKDKKTIYLMLDSNAYFQNRYLESPSGLWLKELGEDKNIKIVLPSIIEMESRSHLETDLKNNLESLNESMRFIQYLNKASASFIEEFKGYQEDYKNLTIGRINKFFTNDFFIREDNFNLHTHLVFKDYFSGEGNFRNEKSRKDIPDSFIYQSLKHFQDEIFFICKDEDLKSKAKLLPNVRILTSIEEFLELKEIKVHIDKYKNEKINQKKKDYLKTHFIENVLTKTSREIFDEFLTRNISYRSLKIKEGGQFRTKMISMVNNFKFPKVNDLNISLIPNDSISIKFKTPLDCILNDIFIGTFGHQLQNMIRHKMSNFIADEYVPLNFINSDSSDWSSRFTINTVNDENLKGSYFLADYNPYKSYSLIVEITLQYTDEGFDVTDLMASASGSAIMFETDSSHIVPRAMQNPLSKNLKLIDISVVDE